MKNANGFTLIEVLVAAFLMGVLGLGILSLQKVFTDNQIQTWKNFAVVDDTNRSISEIVRELRTARPSDSGAYTLAQTNDQEIIFYSDIDFDQESERVHYFLSGTQLYKGVIEPTGYPLVTYPPENENVKLITDNVRNAAAPVFYYFNSDWPIDAANNPLAPADRIAGTRLISIYLRLNADDGDPDGDYILESYSQLRMLKDNI